MCEGAMSWMASTSVAPTILLSFSLDEVCESVAAACRHACLHRVLVLSRGKTTDVHGFGCAEKVIKGWDIGVATMNVGELARFIIAPEYAYGSQGFAPKVCTAPS